VFKVLTEKMRVGPKGQVVVPQSFRKILKIGPGSEVVFQLEGKRVILRKDESDPILTFETISRKGKSVSKISAHAYERELARRHH
jgi:AbrB family looped-hinge helix DNA binding protein